MKIYLYMALLSAPLLLAIAASHYKIRKILFDARNYKELLKRGYLSYQVRDLRYDSDGMPDLIDYYLHSWFDFCGREFSYHVLCSAAESPYSNIHIRFWLLHVKNIGPLLKVVFINNTVGLLDLELEDDFVIVEPKELEKFLIKLEKELVSKCYSYE